VQTATILEVRLMRLILKNMLLEDGRRVISAADLPMTIGRSRRAGITISDSQMSRIHSEFRLNAAGRIEIADMQSTNLTIVNDQDVEHVELKTGDRVLLGDTEFQIEIDHSDLDLHERTTREIPLTGQSGVASQNRSEAIDRRSEAAEQS
jgi:pSer/pThr/pTyr-binding forkhead associated (FHA) protein